MHTARWTPWIDRLLATALAASLAMAVLTATLPSAHAAERVVGSGQGASEQRTLGEFDGVAIGGSFQVLLRQGSTATATVTADNNLLPLLETVVEDSRKGKTLQVRWKRGSGYIVSRSTIKVEITTPRLSHLQVSGSGNAVVENFKLAKLGVDVSGSGDLQLKGLSADALGVAVAGSGNVKASGTVKAAEFRIAGSGDVQADALKADELKLSIAGSGDATVHAERTLDVSVAGSGSVRYSGNPTVKSSVAGSGSVKKL